MEKSGWVRMIDGRGNVFDRLQGEGRIYDVGVGELEDDIRVMPSDCAILSTEEAGGLHYPMPLKEAIRLGAAALDRLSSGTN